MKSARLRYRVIVALLIVSLLLASSLTRSQLVIREIGVIATVLVCGIIVFTLLASGNLQIQVPPTLAIGIGGIFLIFVLHVVLGNYGSPSLILWPFYTMGVATVTIFIIPAVFEEELVFTIISIISAIFGLIGMFTVFISPITIAPFAIEIASWPEKGAAGLPVAGALRATLANPNFAGILFAVASVATLYRFALRRGFLSIFLFSISIFSLWLTQSRASFALFASSIGVLITYKAGRRILSLTIFTGVVCSAVFILSRIHILPEIEYFEAIPLTGRDLLWRGALDAVRDSWLIGVGVYDTAEVSRPYVNSEYYSGTPIHGSYFHLLLRTGVVGLSLWLIAVWGSIASHLRSDNLNLLPLALTVGFGVLMIFEGVNVFGTRLGSILMGLSFGYVFSGHVPTYQIQALALLQGEFSVYKQQA